jgi:TRAP-type mannitol/chloroaromatic compound transport system permease small subunit
LIELLDRWTDRIGHAIAWLTYAMMAATVVVVVLRYGFDIGAMMLQESVVYMHGIVFMLGIGYTLKVDGHVRVDLVYSRLSPVARRRIDLVGHVVFLLPVAAFILIGSLDYVAASWRVLEKSPEVGGIPAVFLLKTLIPLMAAALLLQGLIEIARTLLGQEPDACA